MEVGDPTHRSIDPKLVEHNSNSNKGQQQLSRTFSLSLGLALIQQVQLIRLTRLSTLQLRITSLQSLEVKIAI